MPRNTYPVISEPLVGHELPSESIRDHVFPSEVVAGQFPSEPIRGHVFPSEPLSGAQPASQPLSEHPYR